MNTTVDWFTKLKKSCMFENVAKGRQGANVIDIQSNLIPLVRTTTPYQNANQTMTPVYYELMKQINQSIQQTLDFNNALVELYSSKCSKMGFHSDQSQDLNPDSFICIFSCYDLPTVSIPKKLKIQQKMESNIDVKTKTKTKSSTTPELNLHHNSITLFSVNTNSKYQHKIISPFFSSIDPECCIVTFRQSKTFITFDNNNKTPFFVKNNTPLRLASDDERMKLYQYKSLENSHVHFKYPDLDWTISPGDLIEPIVLSELT